MKKKSTQVISVRKLIPDIISILDSPLIKKKTTIKKWFVVLTNYSIGESNSKELSAKLFKHANKYELDGFVLTTDQT